MKTFHRNHGPPLDNAGTLAPAYHAVELLSATNTQSYKHHLQMVTAADHY